MKHICELCGAELDKRTGLCPNCDGDEFVSMETLDEELEEEQEEQITRRGIIAIFLAIIALLIVVSVIIVAVSNGWIGGKEKHSAAKKSYETYFNETLYPKHGVMDIEHPQISSKGMFFADMYDLNQDKNEEFIVGMAESSGDNIDYSLSCYEYNPNSVIQGAKSADDSSVGVEMNSTVTVFSEGDYTDSGASHIPNDFRFYLVETKEQSYIFAERIRDGEFECHVLSVITGGFTEDANLVIKNGKDSAVGVFSTRLPASLEIETSGFKKKKLNSFTDVSEQSQTLFYQDNKYKFDKNYKSLGETLDAFYAVYGLKESALSTDEEYSFKELDEDDLIFTYSYTQKTDSETAISEDVYNNKDYSSLKSLLSKENEAAFDSIVRKNKEAADKANASKTDVSFGGVVKSGEYIYYWKYSASSFSSDTSESANYRYSSGAENQLIRRSANGEETVLVETAGAGNLAIAGHRIFFQKANGNSNNYNVDSCDMDGNDVQYHDTGVIAGVVQNGAYVIYSPDNAKYDFGTVKAVKTESLETVTTVYNARFLACDNDRVYYQAEQAEYTDAHHGKTTCSSVFANGSASRTLYVTDSDLYEGEDSYGKTSSMIRNAYILNGYIYYSYGGYDSDSGEFKGGKIAKVKLDGSSGEIIAETSSDKFTINASGKVVNTGTDATMSSYTFKDGAAYKFSAASAKNEEIISFSDYSSFSALKLTDYKNNASNQLLSLDFATKTDNKLYFAVKLGETSGSEYDDKGYVFKGYALFEKDLSSSECKEIYSFTKQAADSDDYDSED